MTLKRVYLDQRDWIRLARQYYGREHNDKVADVLTLVREASAKGYASFPLSATHYIETYHNRDLARRHRLGAFMAEISRFHTIASAPDLLDAEVHVAVRSFVGLQPIRRPVPFGRGIKHAFGKDAPVSYFTDPDLERRVLARYGADWVFEQFESVVLTGSHSNTSAPDVPLPTLAFSQRQLDLERETARRLADEGHTTDLAHRLVLAQEAQDVIQPVADEAAVIGIPVERIFSSRESSTSFMLSLPAKGMVCRMRLSGHEDQQFRWHIGDLHDITALATAAAYCDVVVAERHWGHILRRHAGHAVARITSDLLDLPELLLS